MSKPINENKISKEEVISKIKEILSDRLGVDIKKIDLDSNLVEDLGMDSFKAVEIIFQIKEYFKVQIPQRDFLSKISKVREIVNYVWESKKAKK
ncbi:MAG: acyl carrier protein [Candidatus Omnitrophica bacterium]|nr:acyl carrier protein [Candidatus Omnitrophota bacterium]